WVTGALLLQAIVFAAAHANYPQQPAYARTLELFVPALLWGLFYLRFGLLPVVLVHFLHNFSFFSLVLFAASGAGVWAHRLLALACIAAPLALVVWARARRGRVAELPYAFRNGGWRPEPGTVSPARSDGAGGGEAAAAGGVEPPASPGAPLP